MLLWHVKLFVPLQPGYSVVRFTLLIPSPVSEPHGPSAALVSVYTTKEAFWQALSLKKWMYVGPGSILRSCSA